MKLTPRHQQGYIADALDVTDFQMKVYRELLRIPKGCVITYKALAMRLGSRSGRAVGQALKRNPLPRVIPCHRVIASNLKPGGFMGKTQGAQIRIKLRLLAKEGVRFSQGRLADRRRLLGPDSL